MARLPTPGGDDGQWGTILNDFLGQSLTSGGALKDNIVTSSNVADGALPQAKITNLTTDLSNKVDTTDVRLINQQEYYPPQGYGFFSVSEAVTLCKNASAASTATLMLVRVWVPAGQSISSVSALVSSVGTLGAGGVNGFAIYTDAGVLVSSTTSNDNLWTSTGWRTATFSSAIAVQTTNRFVYVGILVNGYSSGPTLRWFNCESDDLVGPGVGVTNRRSFYNGGPTTFPASFNPASYGTLNSFIPLVGLA